MDLLNYIGFSLTVLLAVISAALAAVIFSKGKRDYLNVVFALFLLSLGAWFVSGFVEKILSAPSDEFTVWTFRWANAAACLAIFFYLLFLLGFYLGRTPKKGVLAALSPLGMGMVLISLSPWTIESAHYENGLLTATYGPLYLPLMILFVSSCIAVFCLAFLKWRNSVGIDRERMNLIMLGVISLLPFGLIFSAILPVITGNSTYSSYTFIVGTVPAVLTTYSLIRLRLLDVRIVLRRTGVFFLFLVAVTAPIIILLVLLSRINISSAAEIGLLFSLFVVMLALAPFAWRKLEAYSSRLFFSGLYDASQLREAASASLSVSSDLYESIPLILKLLILPLGLDNLRILVMPGVINEFSMNFECRRAEDNSLITGTQKGFPFLDRFQGIEASMVTEELIRWPETPAQKSLGDLLKTNDISACIPIKTTQRRTGFFLVGGKVGEKALSSTDIRCLEDIGIQVGLYIDNYSLSSELKTRLDELEEVHRDLKSADRFKTEIINVTSHELRTPLTILNSFTQILLDRYDSCSKSERLEYLGYIKNACQRLVSVVGQFSTVSGLQSGIAITHPEPLAIDELFHEIRSGFVGNRGDRIDTSVTPAGMRIVADRYYLSLMLKNMLENALRFSSDTDPVLLKAGTLDDQVELAVQDFGEGIDPEMVRHIFNPFTRLEELDKHHVGTGLGLYTVRLVAALLQTEVHVESVPDQGTTFFFRLHLYGEDESAP